jgi:hypothetical protein
MAKARVYAKLDKAGIGELMKSSELADVLRKVADGVDANAGGGYTVVVDRDRRRSRVISMVLSDSFGKEAATGSLARAAGTKQ